MHSENDYLCLDVSDEDDCYPDVVFLCSCCGCELFVKTLHHYDDDLEYMYDYYIHNMYVDGKESYPNYCPNCGKHIANKLKWSEHE